ncbi:MAG: exodeoxyribonuclease V subunit alpha, partial [Rhodocyclaceae bacterium]
MTFRTYDDPAAMKALLARWAEQGWLRALDAAFADFLQREAPAAPPLLILAAALASHQLGRGHACLDLGDTLHDPGFALSLPPEGAGGADGAELPPLPADVLDGLTVVQWLTALDFPLLVGGGAGSEAGNTPLVRVGQRVYLRRYWQYERDVQHGIRQRLA